MAVTVAGVGHDPVHQAQCRCPLRRDGRPGRARRARRRRRRLLAASSRPTSATSTATRPPARRALYGVGLTGIPIVNVNNNCSTGSSALFLARQAVESGAAECVLALGFEQMQRARSARRCDDRPVAVRPLRRGDGPRSRAATRGPAGRRSTSAAPGSDYAERYGIDAETFAKISVKARRHAANNPYAVFRDPVTVDEVLASPHDLRPADPAAVLPADLRRRGRGRLQRRSSPPGTASTRRVRDRARRR